MKKIILGIVLVALFTVPFVIAQEISSDLQGDPGITPDSSLYGLKLGWENFKLAFIFNKEKKAEKEMKLAEKRLLEAKVMAEKGNLKGMERAQKEHSKVLRKAQETIEKLESGSQNKSIRSALMGIIGLQKAIEVHEQKIEMLKDIASSSNLTEKQLAIINNVIDRMENNTAKLSELQNNKKENFKNKLKAVNNESDEEIEKDVEGIEHNEGLYNARKKIAEKRIEQTEKLISKLKERFGKAKERKFNTSYFEEHLTNVENLVSEAKKMNVEGNYTLVLEALKPVSNFGRNLREVAKEMKSEIKEEKRAEVSKKIEEKFREREGKLTEKLDEIQNKLENKKENIQRRLGNRTNEREGKLTEKLDEIQNKLENKKEDIQKNVEEKENPLSGSFSNSPKA